MASAQKYNKLALATDAVAKGQTGLSNVPALYCILQECQIFIMQ